MSPIKSVQISCAKIHLHKSGIIELKYNPDHEVELMDAIQVESVFLEFSKVGDVRKSLVALDNFKKVFFITDYITFVFDVAF